MPTQLNELQRNEGFCCLTVCCGPGSWCCTHANPDHDCCGECCPPNDVHGGKEIGYTVRQGDSTTYHYTDGTKQEFLALRDPQNTTRIEIIKNKLAGREDVLDEILDNVERGR